MNQIEVARRRIHQCLIKDVVCGFLPPLGDMRIACGGVSHWPPLLERFSNSCALAGRVKGGFCFHPGDEDLSPGAPVRKKPPECVAPVCTYLENRCKPDQVATPQ